MRRNTFLVCVSLFLLFSGSVLNVVQAIQFNLAMLSVERGLVTSNAFQRQRHLQSAVTKLESISGAAERRNTRIVIHALQKSLEQLSAITSSEQALCYLAWSNWRGEKAQLAMQQYAEAVKLNPREPCGWVGLAQICESAGDQDGMDYRLTRFSVPEPEYVVNWRSDSGMTLYGFDADLAALRAGLPIRVNLYWRSNGKAQDRWAAFSHGEWATLLIGQDALQTGYVENLFPDGGFEDVWGRAIAERSGVSAELAIRAPGLLSNKYQYWYGTDSRSGRFECRSDGAPGSDCHLVLDNAAKGGFTGLVSLPMDDCTGRSYLILAHVKDSGQGRNGVSMAWYSRAEQKIRYQKLAPRESLPRWTPVAGVVRVPLDGRGCRVWLMNWSHSGLSFFDDVLMFELPVPPEGVSTETS